MNNKKELWYVFVLAAIQFSHILDFVVMMPLGPTLMMDLGITPIAFAGLVSSYSFSAAVMGVLYGIFADRYDRKAFLMICFTLFIVGTFMCGFADSFDTLLTARIIAGAFGGVITSIVFAMVADLIPYQRRGKALGIIMSAFSVASVAGVPLGLAISDFYDWHSTFYFIGFFSMVIWMITYYVIPSLKEHIEIVNIKTTLKRFAGVLSTSDYLKAFSLVFTLNLAAFSLIPFLSPYAVKNVGLQETDLKYLYLVGGLCTIVSARVIGIATDKWGALTTFSIVSLIACAPIYLYTTAPPMPLWQFLFFSAFFMMFVSGRFIPCMTMVTAIPSSKDRGTFMGLLNSIQGLGSATAAIIGGKIIIEGADGKILRYERVGYMAIALTLLTIAIATYIYHKVAKARIHHESTVAG